MNPLIPVAQVIATGGPHDKEDRVLVELQAELPPVGTKLYAAEPNFSALQAQYQRLLNGVDADLAEIDRIQAVYDTQFRKGRKFRMERDALITQIEHIKRLAMVVIQDRMTHVLVHPCDEYNEEVKVRALPQHLQDLYEAVK